MIARVKRLNIVFLISVSGPSSMLAMSMDHTEYVMVDFAADAPLSHTPCIHTQSVQTDSYQAGISKSTQTEDGDTVAQELILAAQQGDKERVLELLLVPGININALDREGMSALSKTILYGYPEIAETLLRDDRIDVNGTNLPPSYSSFSPLPPLISAIINNQDEILALLLQHPKIDVQVRTNNGTTALEFAVWHAKKELVIKLLNRALHWDINKIDSEGESVLSTAIKMGNTEMVRRLLCYSSEIAVNNTDTKGNTPLMRAVEKGDARMVEELLFNRKINVHSVNALGKTALMIAQEKSEQAIVDLLDEYVSKHS